MWEDNIKMYLKEIEWSGMDWSDMGQNRAVVNVWVP
jgi:hypothetical protein